MSPTQLWGLLGGCLVQCHIVALGLYPCSLDFVGSVTFPAMAVPEVSGRRTAAREQSTLRGNQARPNRYGAPDDDDHDDDDDDRGDRDARRRPRRRPGLGRKGLRGLQPFPPRPLARRDGGRALPPGRLPGLAGRPRPAASGLADGSRIATSRMAAPTQRGGVLPGPRQQPGRSPCR